MFKLIGRHWQTRRERFYLKNRWHLILDFSLGVVIIFLLTIFISFYFYRPNLNWSPFQIAPEKNAIDLNYPPLSYNFSLASSSSQLASGVELKVRLENTGSLTLQNIKTDLVIVDNIFTIKKIELVNPGADIKINSRQVDFGFLGANSSKEIVLKIYFTSKDESRRVINWQAQNTYLLQGQVIKEITSLPNVNLASELSAKAMVYYNGPQGDQLGSGPLPPVISLPTNYWVFFEVKSNGDFKNLVFSAKLSQGVELSDRRSLLAGDFKYNAASRQLVWTVEELKNQSDSNRVGFEIQLIPTANQLDKIVPLVTGIKYYAQDIFTKEEVAAELSDLTTNLDFDRLNRGQGKISQP